jgi:hypothetical protein
VGQLKLALLLENERMPLWDKIMLYETKSVVKIKEKSINRKTETIILSRMRGNSALAKRFAGGKA